jgi:hypothetical protein
MWASEPLDAAADLRQGDLLKGFLLPSLSLPLSYVRTGDAPLGRSAHVMVNAKERDFVVVSQCCTVENGELVALSPIKQTPPLSAQGRLAYEWERPEDVPEDSETQFAFSAFKLEPIPGVLDDPSGGRLRVLNLEDVMSYAGDQSHLIPKRVAQMTPAGRRALRIRLAYFWGRPEAEDEAALIAMGLSPL